MKAASVFLTVGILALDSCQARTPLDNEVRLREAYYFAVAASEDTMSLSTFAKEAENDTATSIRELWKLGRAFMSATLGRLGYGTGPFTWEYGPREELAVQRFQRDLGLPSTGRLDSLTVWHLVRAGSALEVNNMTLPHLSVYKIGQWFCAEGTWKAITDTLAYPVNSVNIVCDALRRECSVVSVDFISENLDQIAMNRYNFVVTHSTGDLLIAEDNDDRARITLTINVPAKEVTWTQVKPARPAGAFSPALGPQQMTMRLVSGQGLSFDDGGDLREVHERLFKDKDRYVALLKKNFLFEETK